MISKKMTLTALFVRNTGKWDSDKTFAGMVMLRFISFISAVSLPGIMILGFIIPH